MPDQDGCSGIKFGVKFGQVRARVGGLEDPGLLGGSLLELRWGSSMEKR